MQSSRTNARIRSYHVKNRTLITFKDLQDWKRKKPRYSISWYIPKTILFPYWLCLSLSCAVLLSPADVSEGVCYLSCSWCQLNTLRLQLQAGFCESWLEQNFYESRATSVSLSFLRCHNFLHGTCEQNYLHMSKY